MIPTLLTIAGSDPSGGAGIQADLKTFSALGAYGCAALTALTAQNTRGVDGVQPLPAAFVAAQIDSLAADLRIDALKIGMIERAEVAHAVAEALVRHRLGPVVLDPVMVAKSGHRLLAEEAVAVLRERLLPLAALITPNLPEAGDLLGRPAPDGRAAMLEAAAALRALGPRAVLLKGGHLAGGDSPDLYLDADGPVWLEAPRIATENTHGTGCTLSAAIAALLPRHDRPLAAVRAGKRYLTAALAAADRLSISRHPGQGHGPVHHFHALWPPSLPSGDDTA